MDIESYERTKQIGTPTHAYNLHAPCSILFVFLLYWGIIRSPLLCLLRLFLFVPWVLDGQAPDIEIIANRNDDINLDYR
jgi:hypothetical protein